MEQLLSQPEGHLRREPSGPFFAPVRTRSTCSGDMTTESSSTTNEEVEEQQCNSRRITLCKQVLLEATTKFSAASVVEMPVLKSAACRNSGALLPLLSMLAAEHEAACMVKYLDTLSFLLLDRANRRVCHELRALDVILDILRRSMDQQVLFSALEALCSLCKHDFKDKMSLWQHPNKGALLSMLSNRHSSNIVVETLRACRTLCFAFSSASSNGASGSCSTLAADDAIGCCREQRCADCSSKQGGHHHHHHHHQHGALQLLEPALLTVAAELLHPSTDTHVLMKALKLLHAASTIVTCTTRPQGCCGCWHNAVFRIVPLLTHCADVDVVESALAVLVNLSEHDVFHNMFFASGCIPPLLHLLSHKRCAISQSASCVLSALAEGGLSRDKLCQDTALLAMLRVLQTNHCVVVTMGVLYMLGRLASYRSQVVRSLKGWGAVPLLLRLLATTRDEDALEGCRQLLQLLGVQPPAVNAQAVGAAHANGEGDGGPKLSLHAAYSSIIVFGGAGAGAPAVALGPVSGAPPVGGALCRTISAAATVAVACNEGRPQQGAGRGAPGNASLGSAAEADADQARLALARSKQHASFRFYGGNSGAMCGPVGPIAAAVTQAAAY